ncbi:tetratricopeptide repeat protein, partial [Aquimarina pacifica]|uniref:tetratricopeptide repeat protein n=1 Tax=Aquimarina pacifica TaxID=1296415 RepID=UPI000557B455
MLKKEPIFLVQAFICCISIFCCHTSTAQSTNDTINALQHYRKADSLLVEDNHDASIALFSQALKIYQNGKAWERVANCYNKISENQWKDEKYEKALKSAEKALQLVAIHLDKDNVEKATAYFNIGNYHRKQWQFDPALHYFKKAISIRQKLVKEDNYGMAIIYGYMALVYNKTNKYDKAIECYKKNIDISLKTFGKNHQKTSDAYKRLGMGYYEMKEYRKSIQNYEKAIKIALNTYGKYHLKTGYIYLRINNVYRALGQYDKALSYLNKSLPIFLNNNDFRVLRVQYWDMAFILRYTGEYDKSLEFMKKSHDLILTYFDEDPEEVSGSYYRLGMSYRYAEDYTKALEYLNKSLQMYISIFGDKNTNISNIYYDIGRIYVLQQKFDKALAQFEKSLTIGKNIYGDDHPLRISLYNSIGDIYSGKKMYDEAILHYQKNLRSIQDMYGAEHFRTCSALYKIGRVYKNLKQYNKAISYFEKALFLGTKKEHRQIGKKTVNPKHFYSQKFVLQILNEQSKVLRYRYQQNENIQDLVRSIEIYKNTEILIDNIRHSYQNYNDKVRFAKKVKEIYSGAIETHLLMNDVAANQQNLEKAFYYAEKSKANTLKELLVDTDAKNSSTIPKNLLEKEQNLKADQAFYQSRIIDAQSDTANNRSKIKKLDNKLFEINRKRDSLNQILENNYPKYYQLKYQNKIATVSEIQEKLPEKTKLVAFFITNATTYAFIIGNNTFEVKELKVPSLSNSIMQLNEAITTKHTNNYKKTAYQLHQQLIAPMDEQLQGNSLIIIPDEALWHLNFETLLTQEDRSENPAKFSYLLHDYAISYANSASLLYNPFQQTKQENQQEGCLAFSFSENTQANSSNNISLAA